MTQRSLVMGDVFWHSAARDNAETGGWYDHMSPGLLIAQGGTKSLHAQSESPRDRVTTGSKPGRSGSGAPRGAAQDPRAQSGALRIQALKMRPLRIEGGKMGAVRILV